MLDRIVDIKKKVIEYIEQVVSVKGLIDVEYMCQNGHSELKSKE